MNSQPAAAQSSTRARTRRAILDAAVTTLSHDSAASLGEIATAAGVGRTTVHRYFAERSDLIKALGDDALERIDAAAARARLGDDTATAALNRLCQEFFELGDILMLVFNHPHLMTDAAWEEESRTDREMVRLIERGQRDGEFDTELDADWVSQLLWAQLYTAWEYAKDTGRPKHDVLSLCLRSLMKSVRA